MISIITRNNSDKNKEFNTVFVFNNESVFMKKLFFNLPFNHTKKLFLPNQTNDIHGIQYQKQQTFAFG